MLIVARRLLVVVMVWQVWLGERRGFGNAQGWGELEKNGVGYCETFAIFNS